jgi:hypothetical protein
LLDEGCGSRGSSAKESVPMPDSPGKRLGRVRAEPDWRVGALHRLGLDRHVLELPESAFEIKPRLV